MKTPEPRQPRRGWPLNYIPAGKENWVAFVQQATPAQIERACLSFSADMIREGRFDLALDGIEAVLSDWDRRGYGGVVQ